MSTTDALLYGAHSAASNSHRRVFRRSQRSPAGQDSSRIPPHPFHVRLRTPIDTVPMPPTMAEQG